MIIIAILGYVYELVVLFGLMLSLHRFSMAYSVFMISIFTIQLLVNIKHIRKG